MTNANFEHRLDPVETIVSILVSHVEAIDSRLEQVTTKLDRIAANQEQSDRRIEDLAIRIDGLTSNVDTLATLMSQQFQRAEQDRVEFRATVQGLLNTLTQRFNSKGHSV